MLKRSLLIVHGLLLLSLLSACGPHGSAGNPSINTSPITITPTIQPTQPAGAHEVTFGNCKQEAPAPVVSAPAPGSQTIYVGSFDSLYAINASNGAEEWCKQATLPGAFPCPGRSCPPPPFMLFGRPAVANGVVYACVSGFGGGYTYALRSGDGSLLWRVKTDCAVASIPFADYAMPLLDRGVVYSGTYALRAQDGAVFWHTSLGVAFQRLVNGVIYACSEETVYALNARDGSLLWHYEVPDQAPISGRLTVDGNRLYFGTQDSVSLNYGALYVLNTGSGALLWRFTQGAYYDINTLHNIVFAIGRDRAIYALDNSSGAVSWSFRRAAYIYLRLLC